MPKVLPTEAVKAIDQIFPPAQTRGASFGPGRAYDLRAVLSLTNAIPAELINLSATDYSRFVRAVTIIEHHLATWLAHGPSAHDGMADIDGVDAITIIRQVLSLCKDEYPPPSTTQLLFISDVNLRDNIRSDIGAANRALMNAEWKAATVLAGATIEALLHWRLNEPTPGSAAINTAVSTLVASGGMSKPKQPDLDWWDLHHFIEIAAHFNLIKAHTVRSAKEAKDFRNLIHPGKAARQNQLCNRATGYSAIGALEHVIRDLDVA